MGKPETEDKPDPAEKPEPKKDEPAEDNPPSRKKTGEAPDNLRRREEWFRKRSG